MINTWIKGGGGIPRSVYMDKGKEFTAQLSQTCYKQLGIELNFAVADNHQSNPVERFHRTLWGLIRVVRKEGEGNLVDAMRTAVMTYNGQNTHQQVKLRMLCFWAEKLTYLLTYIKLVLF